MKIFGLTFLLYVIKWSDGRGFWDNYQNSDNESYKKAINFQKVFLGDTVQYSTVK